MKFIKGDYQIMLCLVVLLSILSSTYSVHMYFPWYVNSDGDDRLQSLKSLKSTLQYLGEMSKSSRKRMEMEDDSDKNLLPLIRLRKSELPSNINPIERSNKMFSKLEKRNRLKVLRL